MKYQLKKVFKLSEMPGELQLQLQFAYSEEELISETIIYTNPNLGKPPAKDWVIKNYNDKKRLNDYLIENGAELNEEVIIDLYS